MLKRRLLSEPQEWVMSFPSGQEFGVSLLYIYVYINGEKAGYINSIVGFSVNIKPGDVVMFTSSYMSNVAIYIDGVKLAIGCGGRPQITVTDHIPVVTGYEEGGMGCP